jgi:hypothetical protein
MTATAPGPRRGSRGCAVGGGASRSGPAPGRADCSGLPRSARPPRLSAVRARGALGVSLPRRRGGCGRSLSASIGSRDPRGFPVFAGVRVASIPAVAIDRSEARVTATGSGSRGSAAKHAARPRLRSTEAQPTVDREPKQEQRSPARPRRIAPTSAAANMASRPAASQEACSLPAATVTARPSSTITSAAQPIQRSRSSSTSNVARAARLGSGFASFSAADPARTSANTKRAISPNTPSSYQRRAREYPRSGDQPIATMRSIGRRARAATASATLTSWRRSRSESRSFGSVIIFMYLQNAIRLASINRARGAACRRG